MSHDPAPSDFHGFLNPPQTEKGVRVLLGMMLPYLDEPLCFVDDSLPSGIDLAFQRNIDGKWYLWRVELEYASHNFRGHHNPADCEQIICWEHNWPDAPVPVLSLKDVLLQWPGEKRQQFVRNLEGQPCTDIRSAWHVERPLLGAKYDVPSQYRGLLVPPTTEEGTELLWGCMLHEGLLPFSIVSDRVDRTDYVVLENDQELRCELEYRSSEYKRPHHRPDDADVIVCFDHNAQGISVPVVSLRDVLEGLPYEARSHILYDRVIRVVDRKKPDFQREIADTAALEEVLELERSIDCPYCADRSSYHVTAKRLFAFMETLPMPHRTTAAYSAGRKLSLRFQLLVGGEWTNLVFLFAQHGNPTNPKQHLQFQIADPHIWRKRGYQVLHDQLEAAVGRFSSGRKSLLINREFVENYFELCLDALTTLVSSISSASQR